MATSIVVPIQVDNIRVTPCGFAQKITISAVLDNSSTSAFHELIRMMGNGSRMAIVASMPDEDRALEKISVTKEENRLQDIPCGQYEQTW